MLFGAIVPELRAEAEELAADLGRLDKVTTEIAASQTGIRDELASLEAARANLETLIARKQEVIAKANGNLDGERRRTRELAKKAKNIKQLMESLAAERARAEAERQRQAKAEEEALIARRRAAEAPRLKFTEARGLLELPAQGKVLRRFGDDDGLGGALKGLVIATRDGAQVTSPVDGKVEFAGPFRSYGEVLILNPGGGYHILLAGLGRITAATGEFLRAGEPVGEMGAGPSSVTLLGDAVGDKRPVLYIEFRNGSSAVDSAPWWVETRKEASG
jgi:septal ring factor EnvC (AmiA/AmiB activator)